MNSSFRSISMFPCGLVFLLSLLACTPSQSVPIETQKSAPTTPTNPVPTQIPIRSPIARAPSTPAVFVFSGPLKDNDGIYLADTSATSVKPLTGGGCPAFSPDGSRLAFCSGQRWKSELFVMNSDGSNPHRLTDKIQDCGCSPDSPLSWSPDGKWVSLPAGGGDKNPPAYDIFAVSADGAQAINLTASPQRYGGLVWDPDSQSILFSGKVGDKPDIYRININTKKITPLTGKPITGSPTGWSLDGSKLLYFADSGGGNFDIFVLQAGQDQPLRLTEASGFDSYPQWFPDGQQILFVSGRDGDNEIYRMNADGSNQTNLTHNPGALDIWQTLSPDGQHVIYLTSSNNQWDSWMMNPDGSGRKKMTELIGIPSKITWKP